MLALFCLLGAWVALASAAGPPSGCVWLFAEENFAGEKKEMCKTATAGQVQVTSGFNDKSKSIQLAKDVEATIYEHNVGTGRERTYANDQASLGDMASVASNIRIDPVIKAGPGCVVLFDQKDFKGVTKEVCGAGEHNIVADFNDRAESVKVGPDVKVELYQHGIQQGTTQSLEANSADLGELNNHLSTFKIEIVPVPGSGCVWLFDGKNFHGEKKEVCGRKSAHESLTDSWAEKTERGCFEADWNDKAESVKVAANVDVDLYQHGIKQGIIKTVEENIADLGELNNHLSTFTIAVSGPGQGCVVLFDGKNYVGEKAEVCGVGHHGVPAGWNDKAESVQLGPGTVVELFQLYGAAGDKKTIAEDIADLGAMNNHLSSFTIANKPNCVVEDATDYPAPNVGSFQSATTEGVPTDCGEQCAKVRPLCPHSAISPAIYREETGYLLRNENERRWFK